jgi:hypothetical protein
MSKIRTHLEKHLQSVFDSDIDTYHATTADDLTLYEWFVTPHRIDGLPFHDFMILEAGREDTTGIALDPKPEGVYEDKPRVRFDLANYHEQVYGDAAICSYTLLLSRGTKVGVEVSSYNESRVLIRENDAWKVVHVHKSPSWKAPFQAPEV